MFRTQIGGVFGFIDPCLAAGLRDLRDTTTELIGVTGVRCLHDALPILRHLIRFAVMDRSLAPSSSHPGESHSRALTEPYVSLSTHTALPGQPL